MERYKYSYCSKRGVKVENDPRWRAIYKENHAIRLDSTDDEESASPIVKKIMAKEPTKKKLEKSVMHTKKNSSAITINDTDDGDDDDDDDCEIDDVKGKCLVIDSSVNDNRDDADPFADLSLDNLKIRDNAGVRRENQNHEGDFKINNIDTDIKSGDNNDDDNTYAADDDDEKTCYYSIDKSADDDDDEIRDATNDDIRDATNDDITDATNDDIRYATNGDISDATNDDITGATNDDIRGATNDDITDATVDYSANATNDDIRDVTNDYISDATNDDIRDATNDNIRDATDDDIRDATNDDISDATNDDIRDATNDDITDATNDDIRYATNGDISDATNDDIRGATNDDITDATVDYSANATNDNITDATNDHIIDANNDDIRDATNDDIRGTINDDDKDVRVDNFIKINKSDDDSIDYDNCEESEVSKSMFSDYWDAEESQLDAEESQMDATEVIDESLLQKLTLSCTENLDAEVDRQAHSSVGFESQHCQENYRVDDGDHRASTAKPKFLDTVGEFSPEKDDEDVDDDDDCDSKVHLEDGREASTDKLEAEEEGHNEEEVDSDVGGSESSFVELTDGTKADDGVVKHVGHFETGREIREDETDCNESYDDLKTIYCDDDDEDDRDVTDSKQNIYDGDMTDPSDSYDDLKTICCDDNDDGDVTKSKENIREGDVTVADDISRYHDCRSFLSRSDASALFQRVNETGSSASRKSTWKCLVSGDVTSSFSLESDVLSQSRFDSSRLAEDPIAEESGKNDPLSRSFMILNTPVARKTVDAFEEILKICQQSRPLTFWSSFTKRWIHKCRKIGEGTFAEVFEVASAEGIMAVKVVPIREDGDDSEGADQQSFMEIHSEVVISKELFDLRRGTEYRASTFVSLEKVWLVSGKYPRLLLDAWDEYDAIKQSENQRPDAFTKDQNFAILGFEMGGISLESSEISTFQQAVSVIKQVSLALAVAEESLQYEHRDLHLDNILVKAVDSDASFDFFLSGRKFKVKSHGIRATIIDYTLSRMTKDGYTLFKDLAADEDLFQGQGDIQYDVYRDMRKATCNNWSLFRPATNVLWLRHLLAKLTTAGEKPRITPALAELISQSTLNLRRDLATCVGVSDLVTRSKFFMEEMGN